jgi:hypothetical protein
MTFAVQWSDGQVNAGCEEFSTEGLADERAAELVRGGVRHVTIYETGAVA